MAPAFFTFLPFYLSTFKTPVENPFHNLWKTFPLSTHFTTRLLSTTRAVDIQHEINMLWNIFQRKHSLKRYKLINFAHIYNICG